MTSRNSEYVNDTAIIFQRVSLENIAAKFTFAFKAIYRRMN